MSAALIPQTHEHVHITMFGSSDDRALLTIIQQN